MRSLSLLLTVIIGLAGCTAPEQVAPDADAQPETPQPPTLDSFSSTAVFGVGDVEVATQVVTQLAPQSRNATTKVDFFVTPQERLTRAVVDFFEPYPEELWVTVTIAAQSNYPGHAVYISTTLWMGDKELTSFSYLTGPDASEPYEKLFNISELVPGDFPKEMVLDARSEITLYKHTAVEDIDVNNPPELSIDNKAHVMGNTLNITFRS